jgi:hypothetical protein
VQHVQDFVRTLEGFDEASVIPLASYRDASTLFVTPTRNMMIPHCHDAAVRRIAPIQNQKRAYAILPSGEVADAYNQATTWMMSKEIAFLFTLEDDNIPPWDVHLKLLDAMHAGGFDAIGGLYRAKAPGGIHMAFGDPEKGPEDLTLRDPSLFIRDKAVMEVNALATGCTIFSRALLEELTLPDGTWFRQVARPDGACGHDIDFSLRARAAGKRLGVHCGVLVGHYDVSEGLCYWPHVEQPTRSLECPG